jgi:hypothetical protein
MKLLKIDKDSLTVSVSSVNQRLRKICSSGMQLFGMRETEYEVWLMFEPAEREESCFFIRVEDDSESAREADILSHWQGNHLFVGELCLAESELLALFRKRYD